MAYVALPPSGDETSGSHILKAFYAASITSQIYISAVIVEWPQSRRWVGDGVRTK